MQANGNFQRPITAQDVEDLFRLVLKRPTHDDQYVNAVVATGVSVSDFLHNLSQCDELKTRLHADVERKRNSAPDGLKAPVAEYRAPRALQVADEDVKTVLMVASCLGEAWKHEIDHIDPAVGIELHLGGAVAEKPQRPIESYDFQVVQITLRAILPDFQFALLKQADLAGHEALFQKCKDAIAYHLKQNMKWSERYGILTFVMSFMTPQQNLVGRLLPHHSLTNPKYFVARLNEHLEQLVGEYKNAYYFDIDEVAASLGKRFSYEDHFVLFNHGGVLLDYDYAFGEERLEPIRSVTDLYDAKPNEFLAAVWREIRAMYRTVRQIDSVKMVVVDLDDTFWRGVLAEAADLETFPVQEGFPRGLWEALLILKRRGVLLAINSKNEESVVRDAWPKIVGTSSISLDDFAVSKINWAPKSENLREILEVTNLLPRNVVYIDDNPLNREEALAAFPELRTLGGTPGVWRHVLLWAPETQVTSVSKESGARTEMVRAQAQREEERKHATPEAFLATLQLKLRVFAVEADGGSGYKRALELINKTNQFNTTGQRWPEEAWLAASQRGLRTFAFTASDRFTDYGLIGVALIEGDCIAQFVMSCRVMGLEIELAVVRALTNTLGHEGHKIVRGAVTETSRNTPCRALYERAGFALRDDHWQADATKPLSMPAHIEMPAASYA